MSKRLKRTGANCRLIWSIGDQTDVGLLDILPQDAMLEDIAHHHPENAR